MQAQHKTEPADALAVAVFDHLAEAERLRGAVFGAALALGLSDEEARRCGDMRCIEIDSVVVTLESVRASWRDNVEPDSMGPDWMLTAQVFELTDTQPLRSTTTCMLLLHMSMASQIANGCTVGYDGEEGVHVLRATERNVSPQALAAAMTRVAATVTMARQLPAQLDAAAASVSSAAETTV